MKRIWAALGGLFLLASSALAQGGSFNDVTLKSTAAQGGATVRVCTEAATGTPCSPLANIYSDAALSVAKSNPTTSDARGNFSFYAVPNRYKLQISGSGIVTYEYVASIPGGANDAVRFAHQFPGANAGAKIAACIADLPSTGGTCDARGLEGAQTISQDVFSGVTKIGTLLLGSATFTNSVTQTAPANWRIQGVGRGATAFTASGNATGCFSAPDGASNIEIEDVDCVGTGAASTAVGIKFTNTITSVLRRVSVRNFNVGWQLVKGTNSSYSNSCFSCKITSNNTINIDAQQLTNDFRLYNTTFGGGPAQKGLRFVDSTSLSIFGGDVEGVSVAPIDIDGVVGNIRAAATIYGLHLESNKSTLGGDINIGATNTVLGVDISGCYLSGDGTASALAPINVNKATGVHIHGNTLAGGYTTADTVIGGTVADLMQLGNDGLTERVIGNVKMPATSIWNNSGTGLLGLGTITPSTTAHIKAANSTTTSPVTTLSAQPSILTLENSNAVAVGQYTGLRFLHGTGTAGTAAILSRFAGGSASLQYATLDFYYASAGDMFRGMILDENGKLTPGTAGAALFGSTALPVGVIQFGTAATNNFAITPAATAAARIVTLNDPLANSTWRTEISNTETIDLGNVASGACTGNTGVSGDSADVTVTGAAVGDSVIVTAATALPVGVFLVGRVTATNTARYQLCNLSGAAVDRASDAYRVRVLK